MWHLDRSKTYDVYVVRSGERDAFKFGVSANMDGRLISLGARRKLYHRWPDNPAWTALFLEDSAIELAKAWEFERYPDDWFEIDEASVKVIIECISELRSAVMKWSMRTCGTSSFPSFLDVPYGQYLRIHRAYGQPVELAEPLAKFDAQLDEKLRRDFEERRARRLLRR
jgi:hypothetical protein